MKQRNYAVDFWRFFATLAVCWGHYTMLYRWGKIQIPKGTFFTSGSVLGVFLIFTGYFLVKSFDSKKKKGLTNISASSQAAGYLKSRYIGLWPALFIGTALGFAVTIYQAFNGVVSNKLALATGDFTGWKDVWFNLELSIFEFLGLDSTGILGSARSLFSWNAPLWYISAILVGGYLVYYLLAKNEELFLGFIAPAFVISCLAVWNMSGLMMNDRQRLFLGLFDNSLIFGMWGMCLGAICYKPYEKLRLMVLTDKGRVWMTVLNVFFSGALFYWLVTSSPIGGGNNELFLTFWIVITMAFSTANQDYLTQKVYNHKIFGTLGEFSLYFFICHMPVISWLRYSGIQLSGATYYQNLGLIILISSIGGVITMFICKKLMIPALTKLDKAVTNAVNKGISKN